MSCQLYSLKFNEVLFVISSSLVCFQRSPDLRQGTKLHFYTPLFQHPFHILSRSRQKFYLVNKATLPNGQIVLGWTSLKFLIYTCTKELRLTKLFGCDWWIYEGICGGKRKGRGKSLENKIN